MTYQELKHKHQEEFNAFPIHFAFGQEQIDAKLKELGLTHENYQDHVTGIGAGGFILNEDKDAYIEMCRRHRKEVMECRAADKNGDGFLYDMFRHELENHEYGYTTDPTDAIAALGLTIEDINKNPAMVNALDKAMKDIREAEGFEW